MDAQTLTRFVSDLAPRTPSLPLAAGLPAKPAVLDASPGAQALAALRALGCEAEPFTGSDLRLSKLPVERFDAIWSEDALGRFSIEECQRVLAIFLQALKPRTGRLYLSYPAGKFDDLAFESLLRQSGFRLELRGERPASGGEPAAVAFFCRRV